MKLIVENFGPIKKGEIDLNKKFYVFVGYNNTGKTYMSQLLWAIFNVYLAPLSKDFENLMDENLLQLESIDLQENPAVIQLFLDKYADLVIQSVIPKCFNTELIKNTFQHLKLRFEYNPETDLQLLSKKFDANHSNFRLFKEEDSYELKFSGELSNDEWGQKYKSKTFSEVLQSLLFQVTAHDPVFLPASRTFFSLFYKYIFELERDRSKKISDELQALTNALGDKVDKMAIKAIQRRYLLPYTKTADSVFNLLYNLNIIKEEKTEYLDLLYELSEILGGSIVNKSAENIGINEFYLRLKDTSEIPMYLASSSVNQLTLLNLFFKYWATEKYNFLFIDEPEENLHPGNQIKLTNLLLKFATRNHNRVLITTHSPLIAENINNYLYLNHLKTKYNQNIEEFITQNGLNLENDIDINNDEVGVYFFDGKRIVDYKNKDIGTSYSDFVNVNQQIEKAGKVLTDFIYSSEKAENNKYVFQKQ